MENNESNENAFADNKAGVALKDDQIIDLNKKDTAEKPQKKKFNIVRMVLIAVCAVVFVGCAIYLGKYYYEIGHAQSGIKDLKSMIEDTEDTDSTASTDSDEDIVTFVEVDGRNVQKKFANLYRENHDFVGWITIQDTLVDYPVMQNMDDNEFYIHRNYNKEYDGSGLPFLDIHCDCYEPTDNLMIYGHNMKAGTMFAQIMKYKDQDFYEKHPVIRFDTLDSDNEYEVVAAFYSEIYPEDDTTHFKYYTFFDAEDQEQFDNYVENVLALSTIDTGIVPEYGDELITLSTCAYHAEEGRFALVARKKK